jgi:hypothetical protein
MCTSTHLSGIVPQVSLLANLETAMSAAPAPVVKSNDAAAAAAAAAGTAKKPAETSAGDGKAKAKSDAPVTTFSHQATMARCGVRVRVCRGLTGGPPLR